jgi:hypothetical protein
LGLVGRLKTTTIAKAMRIVANNKMKTIAETSTVANIPSHNTPSKSTTVTPTWKTTPSGA